MDVSSPKLAVFRKLKKEAEKGLRIFVERVRREYPGTSIVLFGSRARGDYLPYSDWDIAVIARCRGPSDKIRLSERIHHLKPPALPLDLLVICLEELEDPIVRRMLSSLKVLYDGLGIASEIKRPQAGMKE